MSLRCYGPNAIALPYYSMRLLPYVVPLIATWKRRVLREKDFPETEGLDLIG